MLRLLLPTCPMPACRYLNDEFVTLTPLEFWINKPVMLALKSAAGSPATEIAVSFI